MGDFHRAAWARGDTVLLVGGWRPLAGLAMSGRDGQNRLLTLQSLQAVVGDRFAAAQDASPRMPVEADEVCERSLRVAVQLIGSPRVDAGKKQKGP